MTSMQALDYARHFLLMGDLGKAFSMYILDRVRRNEEPRPNLDSDGRMDEKVDSEFLHCARLWFQGLLDKEMTKEMLSCLETALSAFLDLEVQKEILVCSGSILYLNQLFDDAFMIFRRAQVEFPDSLAVLESCDRVINKLVSRWHFRMLNDKIRNERYLQAIKKMLDEYRPHNILDIGSGTGLLSMFCANWVDDNAKIIGCETSKVFHELSLKALKENNLANRVISLNKLSLDLEVGRDIPEECEVIVMEIFDCGLLGEGVFKTIIHALKHLAVAPHAHNPPQGSILSLGGSETIHLLAVNEMQEGFASTANTDETSTSLSDESRKPLVIPCKGTLFGVLIECQEIRRSFSLITTKDNTTFGGISIQTSKDLGLGEQEPYYSEFMSKIRGCYKELSEPVILAEFDFQSLEDLEKKLNSAVTLDLPIVTSGDLDALMVWFRLELYQDIYLSSSPDSGSCWEQAIYPVKWMNGGSQPPRKVKAGQSVMLTATCLEQYVDIKFSRVKDKPKEGSVLPGLADTSSPSGGQNLCLKDHTEDERSTCQTLSICLEPSYIRRLNDETYYSMYSKVIDNTAGVTSAICLCERFSFLPLLAAKKGLVYVPQLHDKELKVYSELCCRNNIPKNRIRSFLDFSISGCDPERNGRTLLILELLEPYGLLKDGIFEQVLALRSCLSDEMMTPVPCGFAVHGQLVSSEFIRLNTSVVSDEVTLGYKVRKLMNEYQVSTFQDIDLLTLGHTYLSEDTHLLSFSFKDDMVKIEDHKDGIISRNRLDITITRSGLLTALVLWFDIHLSTEVTMSTKANEKTHWRQAAVVLSQDVYVTSGEMIQVELTLHASNLHARFWRGGKKLKCGSNLWCHAS